MLLAALLRQGGFDVLTTQEAGRAALRISDEDQLAFASDQGRAVLTHNARDFEPLARKWAATNRTHAGIIVCSFRPAWQLYEGMARLQDMYPDGIAGLCLRLPAPR